MNGNEHSQGAWADEVAARASGEDVPGIDAAALTAHVNQSPAAKAELAEFAAVNELLAANGVTASLERLRRVEEGVRRRRTRLSWSRMAVAAAIITVVGIGAAYALYLSAQPDNDGNVVVASGDGAQGEQSGKPGAPAVRQEPDTRQWLDTMLTDIAPKPAMQRFGADDLAVESHEKNGGPDGGAVRGGAHRKDTPPTKEPPTKGSPKVRGMSKGGAGGPNTGRDGDVKKKGGSGDGAPSAPGAPGVRRSGQRDGSGNDNDNEGSGSPAPRGHAGSPDVGSGETATPGVPGNALLGSISAQFDFPLLAANAVPPGFALVSASKVGAQDNAFEATAARVVYRGAAKPNDDDAGGASRDGVLVLLQFKADAAREARLRAYQAPQGWVARLHATGETLALVMSQCCDDDALAMAAQSLLPVK